MDVSTYVVPFWVNNYARMTEINRSTVEPHIWANIDHRTGQHWLWLGRYNERDAQPTDEKGLSIRRYLFEALVDDLQPGEILRRTCDEGRCVLPSHARALKRNVNFRN